MLEHESLQGISSMKPSGFRKRSNSIYEDSDTYTISSIIQQLSVFHSTMSQHGMAQGLINQAVKQLFYLVGAITLNSIMLRKDMCSCRKGMQIRSGLIVIKAVCVATSAGEAVAVPFVQVQHQLPGGVAEGQEAPKLQRHKHPEAAVSGRLAAAGQQVHRWRCQGDR